MGNLARHCETLVEDMTPIKRTLPSPSPGPSHQSIPAILVLSRNAIFYVLYYDTEHTSLIIDDDALNETVFCDNLDTVVNEMIQ